MNRTKETPEGVAVELPKYLCHKTVYALEIAKVIPTDDGSGGAIISPADVGYADFPVSAEFVEKHQPAGGGFYVVYRDGYKSYSPRAPFMNGYKRL